MQEKLFQRIKELLPPTQSLADAISEILHVSPDSAYRRIRGETLLVLEEARVLCERFFISLDQLFQLNANSVVFHNTEIDRQEYDFTCYLQDILDRIKQLDQFREKSIFYLTKDLPIFHPLGFRPLLAFRYYFWMRTTVEMPDALQQPFSVDLLPARAEVLGREILSCYNRIPSVEIWNTESVNGILQQIHYARAAGLLTKMQAAEVMQSLRSMLEHLQKQAMFGRKFLPDESPLSRKDNFRFFFNRLGLGDNLILTNFDGKKAIYVNNDALDYLTCTDEKYCNKVEKKFQTAMRRSTLLSSVSEKQRNMFFNSLYAKLPEDINTPEKSIA